MVAAGTPTSEAAEGGAGLLVRDVMARDGAGPRGASRGALAGFSLELRAGAVAVLGAPEDGTFALVEVLSGERRPARGSVLVAGADPARSPEVRRRIGCLGHAPALPAATTVAGSVAAALRARGSTATPREVLARAGAAGLADRSPLDLSRAEQRGAELALALAVDRPLLIVLFEPFTDVAGAATDRVLAEIARLGDVAPVVVLTSSPADAKRLPSALHLTRGRLARATGGAHEGLGTPIASQLCVWVESGARELAAVLAAQPSVASLILSADAPGDLAVVRLGGTDARSLALALADAVVETGAKVSVVRELSPTLTEITALSEWEVRARQLTQHHLHAAQARVHAELAAHEASLRAHAYAAHAAGRGHAQDAGPAPAWGPAAPRELSSGVLAPQSAPPNAGPGGAPPAPPTTPDGQGGSQ